MWISKKAVRLAAALLAAAVLAPSSGSAAPKQKKLFALGVSADMLSDGERATLDKAIRKELSGYPKTKLMPPPKGELIDLMFDAECVSPDASCLAAIGKNNGADLVLFPEVAKQGGGYALDAKLVSVSQAKVENTASKTAPAASGLTSAVPGLVKALLGPKPAPPKAKPEPVGLGIETTPKGANVFVNGQAVGTTPAAFEGKPGTYTIRIAKEGYEDIIRKVELKEGKPVDLSFELTELAVAAPTPPVTPPPDEDDELYETWWFWTIVGAGAAGATVGILAGAGAFEAEPAPTGSATLLVGQRPDQDFLLQLQRK